MQLIANKGNPRLRESVNYSIIPYNINVSLCFRISRVRGKCFPTAVSDEWNKIGVPYISRQLSRGHSS